MKNLTLKNIAEACNGQLFCNDEVLANTEVEDITTDSRKAGKGSLFVAIKGQNVDGHDYINQTYENGALCVISENKLDTLKPYILVENSLIAIKMVAEFYRQNLDIKVVGISGSVGKTSTKEAIYSVLSEKFNTLKTLGNFNNELGLPLTVFRLRDEHEIAVLEMGISDFGEMTRLAKIARPDVSVITNIGYCHLEKLGDRDGVLRAKTEMFKYLSENGSVVLNGDDDKLITVDEVNGKKPVFYHMSGENSDIYADNIVHMGIKGIKATLHYKDSKIDVNIHIPGTHMVYNALAAMCVGKEFGMTDEEIKNGINKLESVVGRNNIIEKDEYTVIDDCYNANPVSMRASLDVLSFADTRKVAILGDMFELGKDEEKLHEEIGKYIAKSDIDVVVLCGKLMNNAYTYLLKNSENKKLYYFDELKTLLSELDRILENDDTILVKASHGMEFSKIISYIK